MNKSVIALAAASVFAFGVLPVLASPVVSVDAGLVSQASHFAVCLDLMFTNPAEHAKECGPSRSGPVFASSGGFGAVPCEVHYDCPSSIEP